MYMLWTSKLVTAVSLCHGFLDKFPQWILVTAFGSLYFAVEEN